MKRNKLSRALFFLTILAVLPALLGSCRRAATPVVEDYDSYYMIELGPANYITPDGVEVVDRGAGFVEHEVTYLPETSMRVTTDPNPPRDFRFDADAEKRQFLNELENGVVRSAQYSEKNNQQRMKVRTEAVSEEQAPLAGVLYVLREGNNTATIRLVGPKEKDHEINKLAERIAGKLELKGGEES